MIFINDKEHPLEKETALKELFQSLSIDISKGIAIAINNNVIPRSKWDTHKVQSNDKVLLIKATQGG